VVFPNSYRTFLQQFGAGNFYYHEIFGLPRDRLWGDVVMMNQLRSRTVPRHYVKVTEEGDDAGFYLDTSRMNAEGECPLVALGPGNETRVVADSFLDFLRQAREGLI